MFKTSTFDKLLDKATTNLKLDPDWPTIMQICDLIRQGDVPVKVALNNIKKKILHQNPHVATFALLVLESVVKNCGHHVHDEIATKAFMEQLRELVKNTQNEQVKSKVLELVQAWAFAFRSNAKYRVVQETVTIMKAEGCDFPVLKESDAMFMAHTAPEWVDGNVCHRCRTDFGMMMRKHHCRACGNVFCSECSSNTSTLPKFGIEKEVRVCKACYELYNKPSYSASQKKSESEPFRSDFSSGTPTHQSQHLKPKKTEEELKEEEEIQLALALSQSEAEAKEKERKKLTSELSSSTINSKKIPPVIEEEEEEDEDPELARYLNRSYWEKRQAEEKSDDKKSSSPVHFRSSPGGPPSAPTTPTHALENGEIAESELNDFVGYLKSQVEIFVNRMKSNSSRGRSISNDSSVQTLFMNVTMNHSTLLRYIHQQDDSRVYYEGLQDKLAQVKDAMMALDALREEHREKLRREAEEAERQKQLQMAQKLEIMRRRKQEYLQYQRQLAIQKMQEQEREMQIRQEQQKQQYLMGSLGMPQGYPTWDSKVPSMQSSTPHQYGQQYQSLPSGNSQTSYNLPSSSSSAPQQQPSAHPPHLPGMVPQSVIPPGAMPPSGPHSLPPQRGLLPMGPPRVLGLQPNPPRSMPNQPMTQMHSLHMPQNFHGMPLPIPNPAVGTTPNSIIPQSQSLIMPPSGPINVGMTPNVLSNVTLPTGGQMKVNMPLNVTQGMQMPSGPPSSLNMPSSGVPMPNMAPQVSQPRLPPGHSINPTIPSQGMGLQQGSSHNAENQNSQPGMLPQVSSQSAHQQFQQVPPGGEQSHSSSTAELISFD